MAQEAQMKPIRGLGHQFIPNQPVITMASAHVPAAYYAANTVTAAG